MNSKDSTSCDEIPLFETNIHKDRTTKYFLISTFFIRGDIMEVRDKAINVTYLWGALVGNEVTDDYNAGFCGDLAGLYHFYGAEGKGA